MVFDLKEIAREGIRLQCIILEHVNFWKKHCAKYWRLYWFLLLTSSFCFYQLPPRGGSWQPFIGLTLCWWPRSGLCLIYLGYIRLHTTDDRLIQSTSRRQFRVYAEPICHSQGSVDQCHVEALREDMSTPFMRVLCVCTTFVCTPCLYYAFRVRTCFRIKSGFDKNSATWGPEYFFGGQYFSWQKLRTKKDISPTLNSRNVCEKTRLPSPRILTAPYLIESCKLTRGAQHAATYSHRSILSLPHSNHWHTGVTINRQTIGSNTGIPVQGNRLMQAIYDAVLTRLVVGLGTPRTRNLIFMDLLVQLLYCAFMFKKTKTLIL